MPISQEEIDINNNPKIIKPRPELFVNCDATHNNHPVAAYIGNARISFNVFIQFPGLGKNLKREGKNAIRRKGEDNPMAKPWKINKVVTGLSESANPIAVAIKGAVQGEATTVARTPVKKDPIRPFLVFQDIPIFIRLEPRLKTPERLKPAPNITYASSVTKYGD